MTKYRESKPTDLKNRFIDRSPQQHHTSSFEHVWVTHKRSALPKTWFISALAPISEVSLWFLSVSVILLSQRGGHWPGVVYLILKKRVMTLWWRVKSQMLCVRWSQPESQKGLWQPWSVSPVFGFGFWRPWMKNKFSIFDIFFLTLSILLKLKQ